MMCQLWGVMQFTNRGRVGLESPDVLTLSLFHFAGVFDAITLRIRSRRSQASFESSAESLGDL